MIDRFSRYIHGRMVVDRGQLVSGHPNAIDQINQFIQQEKVDVVVASDTRCTRMLTRCCDQIQGAVIFPLPLPELFDLLYDKWQFAQVLANHSFPLPETHLIETAEQVQHLDCSFQVLVKPHNTEGGKTPPRFENRATLKSYIHCGTGTIALPSDFVSRCWQH